MRAKPLRAVRSMAHETRRKTRERFDALAESQRKQRRLGRAITMIGGVFLAMEPAAAQFGENTQMLCGTGADAAYVFIMSMLVLYGLVMSSIQGGFGLVNLHNTDEDKHRKGERGLKSAGTSACVILIPILLTVFIEAIGVAVASCFIPDIGVIGGTMAALAAPEARFLTEETA